MEVWGHLDSPFWPSPFMLIRNAQCKRGVVDWLQGIGHMTTIMPGCAPTVYLSSCSLGWIKHPCSWLARLGAPERWNSPSTQDITHQQRLLYSISICPAKSSLTLFFFTGHHFSIVLGAYHCVSSLEKTVILSLIFTDLYKLLYVTGWAVHWSPWTI